MLVIGVEKNTSWQATRKAKWCKMQVLCLKIDNAKGVKGQKWCNFTSFLTNIFARMDRKFEGFCKIKNRNLSF